MKTLTTKHLILIAVIMLYVTALFYMSLQPLDHVRHIAYNQQIRNFLHMPAYGVLTILMMLILQDMFSVFLANAFMPVLGMAIAFADEYLQSFAAGRTVTGEDIIRDLIGIVSGMALVFITRQSARLIRQGL